MIYRFSKRTRRLANDGFYAFLVLSHFLSLVREENSKYLFTNVVPSTHAYTFAVLGRVKNCEAFA
jgi:hypothetical protein